MDYTEIKLFIKAGDIEKAAGIANMAVSGGIYIEDYSRLREDTLEIARTDLIDGELLNKDPDAGVIHIYLPSSENSREALSYIFGLLERAGVEFSAEQSSCREEDWANNWKKYFKPVPVGKRLLIRPVWEDDFESGGRAVLNLEPGMAFGTGAHETTRLCLEAVEKYLRPGCEALDIGCGSGILAVAALLLGAESALAVDIDDLAVKTARENGLLNGFSEPRYTVVRGDLAESVTGRYGLVTANIVADAVIKLSPDAAGLLKPGGTYIVSGIVDIRADETEAALKSCGLIIKEKLTENGWVCFVCNL